MPRIDPPWLLAPPSVMAATATLQCKEGGWRLAHRVERVEGSVEDGDDHHCGDAGGGDSGTVWQRMGEKNRGHRYGKM